MAINVYTFDCEHGVTLHQGIDALGLREKFPTIWVDIETEDADLLNHVARQFGLHELAVEDCLTPGHFPKLEDYGTYLFIVLRSLKPFSVLRQEIQPSKDESEADAEGEDKYTRKVALFLGKDFLITYRRKEVHWLDAVPRQVMQYPEQTIASGSIALAHRVVDALVDRLLRGLDYFDDVIDHLEDQSIEQGDEFEPSQILEIKRGLASLRQMTRDQRAVIVRMATDESLVKDSQQRRYFRDIDDHSIEVVNRVEKQLDRLNGIRDVYFAMTNVRLGDTMRILAVITTLGVPLNIVVGLYGMNFDAIPLLHNPYGFWFIVVVMVALTIATLMWFRKRRWI